MTEELSKIYARLNDVEGKINVLITKTDIGNKSRDENIDRLNHIIIGNGNKGLAEEVRTHDNRIQMLEQEERQKKGLLLKGSMAIFALAAKSVWDTFFGKH